MRFGLTKLILLIWALLHAGTSVAQASLTKQVSLAKEEPITVLVSNQAATAQVQATLVASVTAVQPGADIYLGVHQKIIPHWHTYWVNPGDSGNATTIEWTLPEGAVASDILWPAPSHFSLGSITNYAYENDVTLLTKISVPSTVKPGDVFSITALVDWLVCEHECIPQQVTLGLRLPIVAQGESVGEADPRISEAQARLPIASPWPVVAQQSAINPDTNQGQLQLTVQIPAEQIGQVKDIWFYPYDWGRIQQSSPQERKNLKDKETGIQLTISSGEAPVQVGEALTGVLVIEEAQGISRGYEINVPAQALASTSSDKLSASFFSALLFALLGGVILNLMPCVFPVLSIKALSLVSHAHLSPIEVRRQGYVYTLGVLASFSLLAILLIILKAGGAHIGWGFQFQSPIFVLLVAYLLFAVGLSLSGVFFVGGSAVGVGNSLTEKPGYAGSFFTGVLATVVATPCTAPFMAAALGYALSQSSFQLFAIFISLGFGLALPYLLLACWPRLQRWLPRPGAWMERTKQFFAFPMYAAAIWLVWVLAQQAGVDSVVVVLGGMLFIAIGAWIFDITRTGSDKKRWLGIVAALALVLLSVVAGILKLNSAPVAVDKQTAGTHNQHWEPFSDTRLRELRMEGKPVFLNFTASWCISCLVNERVALSTDEVKDYFQQQGIVYLKGDWTNRDPQITAFLQKFQRSGVPLYVFYPAGQADSPIELPQILTPDIVISAVSGQ